MTKLVVGFVPEHFSTPLFLAQVHGFYEKRGIDVEFKPFPSGSGHLIQSLGDGSINIAVGLTDAFVKAQATGVDYYRIVGEYVHSPLCWSISTGFNRDDLSSSKELNGKICGVSRMGSGSDVMSKVFQHEQKFDTPFKYEVLQTFANLRNAVNDRSADFFMWEYFTSKKYYDNKEIKPIGEIYTPWPSWVVTAHKDVLTSENIKTVADFASAVNEGVDYFQKNIDESIKYITDHFDYSEEDARSWLKTVTFSQDVGSIDPEVVTKTLDVLKQAIELPPTSDIEFIQKLN